MKAKNRSSSCFWSWTRPTPGAPWNEDTMTSYFPASVSDTRNESAKARSVACSANGEFLNCSLNRLNASAWLS